MQSTSALIGKFYKHWGEDDQPKRSGPFSGRNFSLPTITSVLNPTAVTAGGQYTYKMTATGANDSDCRIRWSYNIPGAFQDKIFGNVQGDLIFRVPVDASGTWTLPVTARNCAGADTQNFVLTISVGLIIPMAVGISALGRVPLYTEAQIAALPQFKRPSTNGKYDIIGTYSGGYLLIAVPHSAIFSKIHVSQGGIPIDVKKVQSQLIVNTVSMDIYRSNFPLNQISYRELTGNPIDIKTTL